MQRHFKQYVAIGLMIAFTAPYIAEAALLDDIKNLILDRGKEIEKLDKEITQFQTELDVTKKEAGSLQGEIKKIDTTRQQLSGELNSTERNIQSKASDIQTIAEQIEEADQTILVNRSVLAEAIRELRDTNQDSLIEVALSSGSFSDLMLDAQQLDRISSKVMNAIEALYQTKLDLGQKRETVESERRNLSNLKTKLADQKQLVDQTKAQKDQLLAQTKSKEANYQKLLADRVAKKLQVQNELAAIEQQLKTSLNPSLLPQAGTSALSWPLDKVIVTQEFGNTAFAAQTAAYNGKGHNGIDLGTPTGTTLKSAAEGRVIGAGDTDLTCKGASYGKWVLIQHTNGLSTLYAHLSLIKVSEGQSVARGELIGYTGNTGYSTGPHLHFSVFASQGVQVSGLQSKVPGCGMYRLPIASYNSYLNPLAYLPPR